MIGNQLKTGLPMASIVALFGAVGAVLGGAHGMMLALLLGVATTIAATIAGAISALANFGLLFGNREGEDRHPALALAMMIVNPLNGEGVASLFSKHPSTGERVARLRAMAAG